MLTIVTLIAMLKSKADFAPEMFIITGLFDMISLIVIGVTAYNLLELYLGCGGGG